MYLLDTDTIIYSLKGNRQVMDNFARHADAPKAISVITFGELIFGARRSQRVHENLAKVYRLKELLPVIDLTPAIMECFGELKAELQQQGRSVADLDLMIGATALTLGYCIITNNTRHFSLIPGLKTENWAV
jgi:tRNA(fMet)-specific endonuclease VapC